MSDAVRGEGAPSQGDASADGSGDTRPAGPSGVRFLDGEPGGRLTIGGEQSDG